MLPDNFDHNGNPDDGAKRKRCCYLFGGIGALVVIVGIILAVVLSKNGGGDDPGPGPDPPTPPTPVKPGYNPYSVDESTVVTERSKQSGILRAKNAAVNVEFTDDMSEMEIVELASNLTTAPSR